MIEAIYLVKVWIALHSNVTMSIQYTGLIDITCMYLMDIANFRDCIQSTIRLFANDRLIIIHRGAKRGKKGALSPRLNSRNMVSFCSSA